MTGKPDTQNDYFFRINKVLEYINNHLNEDIDLNKLASISNFSVYHFHRIMKAYLKEPLWNYVIRIRLDAAAHLLKYSDKQINEIAYDIGYETPSSFNKAFKKRFSIGPKEFRGKDGFLRADGTFIKPPTETEIMKLKPKIKTIKEKDIIFIATKGYSNETIGPVWGKLVEFIKTNRLFTFITECYGISYDDPKITERENCRYEACMAIRKPVEPQGEIGYKKLPGGKYAVFKYKGSYEFFDDVYSEIYSVWYPKSGEKLRNVPSFEKYMTNPNKTKPENNITEIYIPIE